MRSSSAAVLLAAMTIVSATSAQDTAPTTTPPAAPKPLENELRWYWKEGMRVETADKRFALRIGGLIQWDSNWIEGDAFEAAQPGSTDDGTEFRRIRLDFRGDIYEDWFFRLQPDFAGGEVTLRDAYVGRHDVLGESTDARLGQFKEPIGLEELNSARYLTFVEKPLPIEAFVPSRSNGVGMNGSSTSGAVHWALGAFRASTDDFGFSQEDGGYAVTGRIGWTPLWKSDGKTMLYVGSAYSQRDEGDVRFRSRPEVHLSGRFVDTGTLDNDDLALAGVELAGALSSVHWTGEYLRADVEGAGDPSFDGWYAQVGWFVTGEARSFRRAEGVWDRIKPLGTRGAIELAARYSTIDLDDGSIQGGEEDNVTLGVNWYANANLRFGVNYVHADVDSSAVDDTLDALLFRAQVDW